MIIRKLFPETLWQKLLESGVERIELPLGEEPQVADDQVAVKDWISIFWQRYFIMPVEVWQELSADY